MLKKLDIHNKVEVNKTYLHVVLLLDNSGSMRGHENSVRETLSKVFSQHLHPEPNTETTVNLYKFGNNLTPEFTDYNPAGAVEYTQRMGYSPNENTALYDSLGEAIEKWEHKDIAKDNKHSFLFIIITDGENNMFSRYSVTELHSEIRSLERNHNWTFVAYYNKTSNLGKKQLDSLGFSQGNLQAWDVSREGFAKLAETNRVSTQSFYDDRKRGIAKTVNYFNTDLSHLSTKDIKVNLDDLSGQYSVHEVLGEQPVSGKPWETKNFTEQKLGKTWVSGKTYYQLTKPELIQSYKKVLIMEKGKKAIWGGSQARKLIGLDDKNDANVTPGNHSNYDIFIQSGAHNRKLPRGTKVIVDNHQVIPMKKTWEEVTI